jgi:uncharacterized protein (DUF2252 family)
VPSVEEPPPAPPAAPFLTVAEGRAAGKGARAAVPRSSHAALDLVADRDPLALLELQAQSRVPELVPIRYGRMLVSPLAFHRGSATVMAHDLAATPRAGFRAQLCGDAHLLNFGGFASPERDLVFDVNDFDETLVGPFEWDLKRLATSFEIAARHRNFSDADRLTAVAGVSKAYREAMQGFAAKGDLDVWYARLDARAIIEELRTEHDRKLAKAFQNTAAKAQSNDDLRALSQLTQEVDGQPRFISHPPLIVPLEELVEEAGGAEDLEATLRAIFGSYERSLPHDRRVLVERFRYADLARKVVGIGSVGTRCWVLLLLGRDEHDPLFLQIKEAEASVLEPLLGGSRFANHGQRVVEGQRLMQASSDIFLGWVRAETDPQGGSRDFYVRRLRDWKSSLDIETVLPRGLALYGSACGWTLARAHARSGDRVAIAAYLGTGEIFDRAVAEYAGAYADLNERDHQELVRAVADGRIVAVEGV